MPLRSLADINLCTRWNVKHAGKLAWKISLQWPGNATIKIIAYWSNKRENKQTTQGTNNIWAPSSEFVSSSIPSWQILTAHAQPFRGARDLAFCLKVPLDSLFVWASSGGSGETARMRRLAWTFAARIGDKYQIRLTRSIYILMKNKSKEVISSLFPTTKWSPGYNDKTITKDVDSSSNKSPPSNNYLPNTCGNKSGHSYTCIGPFKENQFI